jgi:iron complex transport system substrate-binding protein
MSPRAAPAQRIVSLAPSVTSILVELGARDRLAGVTKWCASVADVRGLPRLGDCWSLHVRAVARLRPTLVIGSVPYNPKIVAELLQLPVPFLASNPRSLSDIFAEIRLLGSVVGRERRAEKLVARMKHAFERIAAKARQKAGGQTRRLKARPRVYAEAWPHPRIASPPWVAELVELAGGTFVVPAGKRTSDEAVARARPEVIILAWAGASHRAPARMLARALRNPAWQNVPAIRNRRVYVVRDEILNTPGPPLVEGLRQLFRLMHPKAKPR